MTTLLPLEPQLLVLAKEAVRHRPKARLALHPLQVMSPWCPMLTLLEPNGVASERESPEILRQP